MARMKGGELIAEYLIKQKVPYIFGICGHGNVGILDPLHEVRDKLKLDEAQDEDIVATVLGSCAEAAAPSKEPIGIKATVETGIYDPPSADVELTRTFLEASTVAGGSLKIETTPANCNVGN